MAIKLFALGRPGSGKTTAVLHIIDLARKRNFSVLREKEYTILYKLFEQEQTTGYHYFRPAQYSGFDIVDFSILHKSAIELERKIQEHVSTEGCDLVTVEFARDDYSSLLDKFSPEFLQGAYFLFVEASVDTCIQRIHDRYIPPATHNSPPVPDHHFVSDHILNTHYKKDYLKYMQSSFQLDYGINKKVLAYSNTGTLDAFLKRVSSFAESIFDDIIQERMAKMMLEPSMAGKI